MSLVGNLGCLSSLTLRFYLLPWIRGTFPLRVVAFAAPPCLTKGIRYYCFGGLSWFASSLLTSRNSASLSEDLIMTSSTSTLNQHCVTAGQNVLQVRVEVIEKLASFL